MKFSLFLAVLFWMSVMVTGKDPSAPCCLTTTDTKVPPENIVDYTIQESSGWCAIRAVRFHTMKNKVICSDPDSDWAKKIMKIVDGRTITKPIMFFTSTTNTIPPAPQIETTHKTSGTETEISETTTRDHPDCCLTVTDTRTPAENIVNYAIQEPTGICAIRAVRFHTRKNRIICSDPEGSWAKRAMEVVDRRRTLTEEPSEEPTANLITTTAIQRPTTEGYGHPESCCSTTISTTIPVNPPVAFRPLLTRKRSHSKKMLRKYQSNNRNTKYYNN